MELAADGSWRGGELAPGASHEWKGAAYTFTLELQVHPRQVSGAGLVLALLAADGTAPVRISRASSPDPGIECEVGTNRSTQPTRVIAPPAYLGSERTCSLVCRYDGAKLQLLADGVVLDEGFPMGLLRGGPVVRVSFGGRGAPLAVAIGEVRAWTRALSDEEITRLAGGARSAQAAERRLLGSQPAPQYWRPHNRFNVGDTLPLFDGGLFRFYYLQDRDHHTAKGGLGAHQWAQLCSRDLRRWERKPLAVPITVENEASICTGSVFVHNGIYHAFYATRGTDGGERLSLATSSDGVHFTKTQPNPFLQPGAQHTGGFRDPHVFRDRETGLFHLIVSTMLREGGRGCLAHYVSGDLRSWTEEPPFHVEGSETPECPDTFEWNARHYLVFSFGQVARYRMANSPLGPWRKPPVDILDGPAARVMKTAAFLGNRRIGTASIWPHGYAGWAVFRELVQHPDGTLGTRLVPEMRPPAGPALRLSCGSTVRLFKGKWIDLPGAPADWRMEADISATRDTRMKIRLGGASLLFDLPTRTVGLMDGAGLQDVACLDRPFHIEVTRKGGILDLAISGDRTLVNWLAPEPGAEIALTCEAGEAYFTDLEIRGLR